MSALPLRSFEYGLASGLFSPQETAQLQDATPLNDTCISASARLFATRDAMMRSMVLPRAPVVAEIGVLFGDFSRAIAQTHRPSRFVAFDLFEIHNEKMIWGKPSVDTFQGRTHEEYYRQKMSDLTEMQLEVVKGDSAANLSTYPDRTFDFIYIDGAHEEAGVRRDAVASSRKIKDNGLLIFNDYTMFDHIAMQPYGIVQVVNDMCVNENWEIVGFAFQAGMFCDIALRRKGAGKDDLSTSGDSRIDEAIFRKIYSAE